MTGIPFQAFLATGTWAFITVLLMMSLWHISHIDARHFVGRYGRSEFEVWLFYAQLIFSGSLIAFFVGNVYGFGLWVITRLFFGPLLSPANYTRNIVLLCCISSPIIIVLARTLNYPFASIFEPSILPFIVGAALWTAFLGNRFTVAYLRSQQKQKNVAA